MANETPAAPAKRTGKQMVTGYSRRVHIVEISAFVVAFSILSPWFSARAGDNLSIERLATCQDSWLDWKQSNPARLKKFVDEFQSGYLHKEKDPFFVPKSNQIVAGLPVAQVYPESVGMGVGFSVLLNADFDKTKNAVEKKIGKPLQQCEAGDNMRTCAFEIGEKNTITLMADDNPKSTKTLLGCFYLYVR